MQTFLLTESIYNIHINEPAVFGGLLSPFYFDFRNETFIRLIQYYGAIGGIDMYLYIGTMVSGKVAFISD